VIRVVELVAGEHDARRVSAVRETEQVADLVQGLLVRALDQPHVCGRIAQVRERDDRSASRMLSDAEEKAGAFRVQIELGDGEQKRVGLTGELGEQRLGAPLVALSVEEVRGHGALPAPFDAESGTRQRCAEVAQQGGVDGSDGDEAERQVEVRWMHG
jgi:hypothetical protein